MNVHEKYIMDCCGAPHVGQPLKKDGDKPKFYHTFEISQSMSALCSYLDKVCYYFHSYHHEDGYDNEA